MDVKSSVITKIDNLLSEYNEEKESGPVTPDGRERHNAILGAISTLGFLRGQIERLEPSGFVTMGIVERSESEISTLRYAKGYLSQVLFSIGHAREHIRHDGTIGSGSDPYAVQGRNEACDRMEEFVYQLDSELPDDQ